VLPGARYLDGQRPAQLGRPEAVDVQAGAEHHALREVAVDVPAEQRRRKYQRSGPGGERGEQGGAGRRLRLVEEPTEAPPREHEDDHAAVDGEDAGGLECAQPVEAGHRGGATGGQGAGGEPADGDQRGADES
jgi:hypothetical protein